MGQPRPLFRLFLVFSNKHSKFLQQICEKISIQYMVPGLEPTTLERESPPITTRPGLPPNSMPILLYPPCKTMWPDDEIKSCTISPNCLKSSHIIFTWKFHYFKWPKKLSGYLGHFCKKICYQEIQKFANLVTLMPIRLKLKPTSKKGQMEQVYHHKAQL